MKFYGIQITLGISLLMQGIIEGRTGSTYISLAVAFIIFSGINIFFEITDTVKRSHKTGRKGKWN